MVVFLLLFLEYSPIAICTVNNFADNGRFAPVDDTANYHGNEVESSKVASGTFDSVRSLATCTNKKYKFL